MSWISLIFRSALICLSVVQAVFLPRGGCCCAAERLMAAVSGDHAELPACCRVSESREKHRSGQEHADLARLSESGRGECHCIASACDSSQSKSPATAASSSYERLGHWEASQPVLVVALTPLPTPLAKTFCAWELPSLRSGHDARIALHSWRC